MAIKCKRAPPYTSLFFIGFFSGLAEVNPTEVTAKVWENLKMTQMKTEKWCTYYDHFEVTIPV